MSQRALSRNPPMLLYQSRPGRAHVRRQGSALQQTRFDENLKIAEDYICNIKPPFKICFQRTNYQHFVKKVVFCRFFNQEKKQCTLLDYLSARFSDLFRWSTHGKISTRLSAHTHPVTFISKLVTQRLENISHQEYGGILAP